MSLPYFHQQKHLSDYSTFQIGGPARLFTEVSTIDEMAEVLRFAYHESLPFLVLGKGSNILFDDKGFNGLVILNKIHFIHEKDTEVEAGGGTSFSLLGIQTAKKGLAGLEFASGIPGTVGGAVYMSAGANGGETKDSLTKVIFINEKGEIEEIPREKIEFAYRFSSFQKKKGAIVAAHFRLTPCTDAKEKQRTMLDYRMKTQPYRDPSCGCVFVNPGTSAGKLIEECGLKGLRVGGAEVSTLHANFIVNRENAKAQDVLELAKQVQAQVKDKKGIELKLEIKYIPYV